MALPSNFLGDLIAATQGGTVEPQQNAFGRIMSGLGNDPTQLPDLGPVQTRGMTAADAGAAPRMRRSVLDMIGGTFGSTRDENSLVSKLGGLADVIATVGGAQPLFQPGVDARLARSNAAEDRKYEIDNRPFERRLMEQKLASGDQGLEAGSLELQNARNAQLEGVGAGLRQVFGSTGPEGLAKAWPLVAQQFGLDAERTQQIGAAFAQDPEGTLNALFPDPMVGKGGSQAKEAQIYALLTKQGTPEQAAAYLQSLTDPKALTPYQQAQLDLAREKFGFDQYKFANPQPTAGQRTASAKEEAAQAQRGQAISGAMNFLDTLEETVTALNESGGMSNEQQSIGDTIGVAARESIPLVERLASPKGYAARERLDGLLTQGVMSLLPMLSGVTIGSKNMDAAKEMENLKKSIASARSYEAAMAAINQYRQNLRFQQQQKAAPRAAPAPRQKGAPQQRQTAKPPARGTVRQGYRFNGGDPADKSNWTKVQ